MHTLINTLNRRDYLQRITGVNQESFKNLVKRLNRSWRLEQKRKCVAGRPYRIGDLREHLLLLLVYYRTYTRHLFLAQNFHVDEATVSRSIRRIMPLAERILKIKPEKLLSENELQLLIVDATEQCIERPKNQRDYYSGKKHAHTIKTEIITDPKGRILRVSKPYEGRVHDFKIRKTEGPLPAVPILADSGYQGLQNEHSAGVILPKKNRKTALYRLPTKNETPNLHAAELLSNILLHASKNGTFWPIVIAATSTSMPKFSKPSPGSITF